MILLRTWVLALAIALAATFSAGSARAERRIALVIGNNAYQHVGLLQKAVADARGYADVLKAKGFEVTLKTDLTRGEMDDSIATFLDMIAPGDIAVFVYSGHGWSDGAQNYILGTDIAAGGSKEVLARRSIPLKNGFDGVIDSMDQKGAALKVAIIDACRDNPFQPPAGQKGIGLARGMVRVSPPSGTFLVFSAGAGQSALDRLSDTDTDPNGVFTRVFLPLLAQDITLLDAVKAAQQGVSAMARQITHDQWPAYYDEVIGSACLSASCVPHSEAKPMPGPGPSPDEIAWPFVALTTDAKEVEAFIARFPDSPLRPKAEARLQALTSLEQAKPQPTPASPDEMAWAQLVNSNFSADIRDFLDRYPQSALRPQAEARLRSLDEALWQQSDRDDQRALDHYLALFPDGLHRGDAEAQLARLQQAKLEVPAAHTTLQLFGEEAAWARIAASSFSADIRDFLNHYPNSALRPQAEARLHALDDALWAQTRIDDAPALNHYLALFPDGRHRNDAESVIFQKMKIETSATDKPVYLLRDEAAWFQVSTSNFSADIQEFLRLYPNSALRPRAEAKLHALDDALWEQTRIDDEPALNHYLALFPNGAHGKDAETGLAAIRHGQTP